MTAKRVTIPIPGELEVRTVKGILADATQIRYTRYIDKEGKEIKVQDAITDLYSKIVLSSGGFKKLYFTVDGIQVKPVEETIKIFNNIIEIKSLDELDKIIDIEGSFLVKLNGQSIGDLTIYQDDNQRYQIFITNYDIKNLQKTEMRSYQRSCAISEQQWTDWLLLNNKIELSENENKLIIK